MTDSEAKALKDLSIVTLVDFNQQEVTGYFETLELNADLYLDISITDGPTYQILNMENGKVVLKDGSSVAQFTSSEPKLAIIMVSVSDKERHSMDRKAGVYITDNK